MTELRKPLSDTSLHLYIGAKVALATMHGKESAIGNVLSAQLGMEVVVPPRHRY